MKSIIYSLIALIGFVSFSCKSIDKQNSVNESIKVIFDTDANNELDDQHALAYLLFNRAKFDLKAVTVNTTYNGGDIDEQFEEADRVMRLCNATDIPLLKGADGSFESILDEIEIEDFDGHRAVDFIIREALNIKEGKIVFIAVGKLTNLALALKKEPKIASKIRLVWLGSNYPEPGEYNLENDIAAMNYLLDSSLDFEVVTVRYGKASGTDAVRVTKKDIIQNMPGKGPKATVEVRGRHGNTFNRIGDYSVSLFENCDYYGDPPSRALFDMAAVAIVKNPDWAKSTSIPAPVMEEGHWKQRPDNQREILIWEHFNSAEIMNDFYNSFEY